MPLRDTVTELAHALDARKRARLAIEAHDAAQRAYDWWIGVGALAFMGLCASIPVLVWFFLRWEDGAWPF